MKYLHEILWYMSWPLLIVISHYTVKWAIRKFEKENKDIIETETESTNS
ncbi:hypothetical protein SAMN06265379_103382 [Saccharicrinis carchari]|uniref:Uncharacterized protein n=1 Tax=Saccharicrinis carchari TaxID=1168039 RepID=A0A521CPZ0_SACCC|nr:hypothetical protein SAMN06265379_103382 [Saccharicrinis carchari]